MNIPLDLQQIIAQIRTNQEQIKLLTDNNAMLTEFLALKGIEQNHIAFAASHPEFNKRLTPLDGDQLRKPREPRALLAATSNNNHTPEAVVKKRGRPSLGTPRAYPGSKVELLVDYAVDHGGVVNLREFRDWFLDKGHGPESYVKTTMYGQCRSLAKRGFMKALNPYTYSLTPKGEKLARGRDSAQARAADASPGRVVHKGRQRGHTGYFLHLDDITEYARSHGNVIDAMGFKEHWARSGKEPSTYTDTTLYTDMKNMAAHKILRKLGPGRYQLLQ